MNLFVHTVKLLKIISTILINNPFCIDSLWSYRHKLSFALQSQEWTLQTNQAHTLLNRRFQNTKVQISEP